MPASIGSKPQCDVDSAKAEEIGSQERDASPASRVHDRGAGCQSAECRSDQRQPAASGLNRPRQASDLEVRG